MGSMPTHLDVLHAAVNCHAAGGAAEADRLYRRALALDPAGAAAWNLFGVLRAQADGGAGGLTLFRRSVRAGATAAALANLGAAQLARRAREEAQRALRAALVSDPGQPDAAATLGVLLQAAGRSEEAVGWLVRAYRLAPERDEPLHNLGTVLRDARRFAEAEGVLTALLRRAPDHAGAHLALATARLLQGDLSRGFAGLEHRWKRFASPPWTGEPVDGQTLLLHAEQGFGDSIQFARYAPLAADRGARVILEVHPLLVGLLSGLDPRLTVAAQRDPPPPHDRHCPLMSLPRAFGTTLATVPAARGYLPTDPALAARWAPRFGGGGGLRVGLVWAGNPRHANDANRSLPAEGLAPLLAVPDVRFFSLQTGDARADLGRLPGEVVDLMDGVGDFADTAALLASLDLMIAVDTAVVHLAGALGRPAWVLLPFAPDWRWLLDRVDSPWYASLRLFRQPRPGDWRTLLATVAACLRALAARQERSGRRDG